MRSLISQTEMNSICSQSNLKLQTYLLTYEYPGEIKKRNVKKSVCTIQYQ